jgi:protein O-mannosyl-transferase
MPNAASELGDGERPRFGYAEGDGDGNTGRAEDRVTRRGEDGCGVPVKENRHVTSPDRASIVCWVVLIAATWGVYGQIFRHQFLSWDDDVHILENRWLNPVSVEGILRFWWEPYEGLYIPLSYTLFGTELAVSDLLFGSGVGRDPDPRVFHMGRLVLHTGNVLLVFSILLLLGTRLPAACFGALFFSLHPLQAESVAWISETRGLLAGFLSLLAIRHYLLSAGAPPVKPPALSSQRRSRRATVHYSLALTFFILALLAKPAAAAVPVILLVFEASLLRRSWKQRAMSLSPWLIPLAVFLVLTRTEQSDLADVAAAPLWARPLVAADALSFYLGKLVVPIGLAFDYGRSPGAAMRTTWFYWAWLVPLLLVGLMWRLNAGRVWWAAAGLFVAGVLPVLGLIPFAFQATSTVADRYVYLSMLGPALAVAAWTRSDFRSWRFMLFVPLIVVLAGITYRQVSFWADDAALYGRGLHINPESAIAHNNLGNALLKKGDVEGAVLRFRRAVELAPEHAPGHYNLGLALAQRGGVAQAAAHLQRAVTLEPQTARTHYDFAVVLERLDRRGDALLHYRTAVRLDPDDADAHNNLAGLYLAQGESELAIRHLKAALRLRPDWATALDNLAAAHLVRGEIDRAVELLQGVLKSEPGHVRANFNLGIVRMQQGRFAEAEEHFLTVLGEDAEHRDSLLNLALVVHEQQRFVEAIERYDAALRLEPEWAQAYYYRAEALFRLGRKDRALEDLQKALKLVPDKSEPSELIRRRLETYHAAESPSSASDMGEMP